MVNIGVIGCGSVSQTYLYALKHNKYANVTAVVDIEIGRAQKNAGLFEIPTAYSDYKEMLKYEHLDAVVICTPHYVHREQAVTCAEKGLHILCEKPLATTMKDVEDIITRCRNVKFAVMLQRRLYPNSIATLAAVRQSALGKIIEVSLNFRCHKSHEFYDSWRGKEISGGGVLISQALHRIDLIAYFFGKPRYVEGIVRTTRPEIEVEDYAKGKVYFANEVIVDIEANNSSGNSDTVSIIKIKGTRGDIVLSDDKTLQWDVEGIPFPEEADINRIPARYRPVYYGPCHELIIDDFVDAIVNDRSPAIVGEDALASMKIIFGFYAAAKEKEKVLV